MTKRIRRVYALCFFSLFVSCKSHNTLLGEEIAKRRLQHTEQLKLIRLGLDPYYNKVPDSMKKWIKVFSGVLADDQKNRIVGLSPTKGDWAEQRVLDSQNLEVVSSYLNTYGWPTKAEAGFIGARAVGMVVQHSPLPVQEKYYPALVKAYRKDSSLFETLALLEDRINMRSHKRQYYGTQVVYLDHKPVLYPVVSVDSLEIYRSRLGRFIPFVQYLAKLKVNWNPAAYKEELPNLKQRLRVSDSVGIHALL